MAAFWNEIYWTTRVYIYLAFRLRVHVPAGTPSVRAPKASSHEVTQLLILTFWARRSPPILTSMWPRGSSGIDAFQSHSLILSTAPALVAARNNRGKATQTSQETERSSGIQSALVQTQDQLAALQSALGGALCGTSVARCTCFTSEGSAYRDGSC